MAPPPFLPPPHGPLGRGEGGEKRFQGTKTKNQIWREHSGQIRRPLLSRALGVGGATSGDLVHPQTFNLPLKAFPSKQGNRPCVRSGCGLAPEILSTA